MAKRKDALHDEQIPVPGGELEQALLASLWSKGDASAHALHDALGRSRDVVYTTVTKVLDRLVAKGLISRVREGRAYRYHAELPREEVERALARSFLERLTGAGVRPAMAALVSAADEVSPELLEELWILLKAHRDRPHGRDDGQKKDGRHGT